MHTDNLRRQLQQVLQRLRQRDHCNRRKALGNLRAYLPLLITFDPHLRSNARNPYDLR